MLKQRKHKGSSDSGLSSNSSGYSSNESCVVNNDSDRSLTLEKHTLYDSTGSTSNDSENSSQKPCDDIGNYSENHRDVGVGDDVCDNRHIVENNLENHDVILNDSKENDVVGSLPTNYVLRNNSGNQHNNSENDHDVVGNNLDAHYDVIENDSEDHRPIVGGDPGGPREHTDSAVSCKDIDLNSSVVNEETMKECDDLSSQHEARMLYNLYTISVSYLLEKKQSFNCGLPWLL